MSDHVWTQENIAAYLAEGLEPAEVERLERHAEECSACATAIEEARALGRMLSPLFADARPALALEDQIIHALPAEPPPRQGWRPISRRAKFIMAAAAVVMIGVVGASASSLMQIGQLRMASPIEDARSQITYGDGTVRIYAANGYVFETPPTEGKTMKSAEELARDVHMKVRIGTPDPVEKGAGMEQAITAIPRGKKEQEKETAPGDPLVPMVVPTTIAPAPSNVPPPPPAPVAPNGFPYGPTSGTETSPSVPWPIGTSAGDKKKGDDHGAKIPGFGPGYISHGEAIPSPKKMPGGEGGQGKSEVFWKYTNDNPAKKGELPPLSTYFKPGDPSAQSPAGDLDQLDKGKEKVGNKDPRGKDEVGDKGTKGKQKDPIRPVDDEKEVTSNRDLKDLKPDLKQIDPQPSPRKIIIRSGELEFEIDSFDGAVSTIMKLVTASKGGFVATINSDKLANGKVRGSIVVRLPPEQLDQFILDLRKELAKAGELKNQHLGSLDITKQFTDLESRLRAARTMEQRLLNIIKDGKGQIKDLLQAENELGVWRTKIEEMEGEIRYYNNLASLATLTIKLYEKEIRSAALVTENERVQAGIEVEEVEKAYQEALKAIAEVKGRVSKSELRQHAAGQFNAVLHFEVSPESAGATRDRLRQLGNMVRLQIDRLQNTENGGEVPRDAKIKRGDTQFLVNIYNLANIAPRETIILRLAAPDVPTVYVKLRTLITKAKGQVVNANLNEQDRQNISAQLDFHVNRVGETAIQAELTAVGETLSRQVNRVPENENVTDSKVLYRLTLVDADAIQPRETLTMRVAALDVPESYQKLREALAKVKARVINAQLNEQDRRNVTAQLDFTFKRGDEGAVQMALAAAGESLSRQVTRLPESPTVTDAKVLARLELMHADALPPRESVTLKIAAVDVPAAFTKLRDAVAKVKGRIANAQLNEQDRRNVTAQMRFEVPRGDETAVQTVLGEIGEALSRQAARQQDTTSVTDTRVGFQVDITPAAAITPRETTVLALEVQDVNGTLSSFNEQVKETKGRIVETNIGQDRTGQVSARVTYDIPLADVTTLVDKFRPVGQVRVHQVSRDPQAPEGKLALGRIIVTLSNVELLVPADKGLWPQIRHGLGVSLRGLFMSASYLIIGLLFVLPWALLIAAIVWLARRMLHRAAHEVSGSQNP